MEGAGTVVAIGDGVTAVKPGDRVAYAGGPIGAYATERVIAADRLVKLPDGIDFTTAAAMMLQGMTAQYLIRRTYAVKAGETILVHAAAGGVGLILCQWAKHLGATVIGVVSTEEKADLARANGAAHVRRRPRQPARRGEAHHRRRHGAGGLRQRRQGHLHGQHRLPGAARPDGQLRQRLGSGAAGRSRPAERQGQPVPHPSVARRPTPPSAPTSNGSPPTCSTWCRSGAVKIRVNQTFPLREAAAAHIALESRKTTGSTVLVP